MSIISLTAIGRDGCVADHTLDISGVAAEVCRSTAEMYGRTCYVPPWVGYLATTAGSIVGACGFKSPPVSGRVEIAYYTFPGQEGRGIATAMAKQLIAIARSCDPTLIIAAQTLPERNASNAILRKLGFELAGSAEDSEVGTVWEWRLP